MKVRMLIWGMLCLAVMACAAKGVQPTTTVQTQLKALRIEAQCEECAAGLADSLLAGLQSNLAGHGFRAVADSAPQLRVFVQPDADSWLLNWVLNDRNGQMIELSRIRIEGAFSNIAKTGVPEMLEQTAKTLTPPPVAAPKK